MKKRIIAILLVLVTLVSQVPTEAVAFVGNYINTAINTIEENKDNPFIDVEKKSWYYDAVQYVRVNGIFNGTSLNTFDPNGMMTRGMFVTVLGRMAGVDVTEYSSQSPFSDVEADDYYAPYVAWASKYGITVGVGNGKFEPDAIINREQMAVFFVRYFQIFNVDYDTGLNITTVPADIDTVSPWAREMIIKLWKSGLLVGDGINFSPTDTASRAQVATICMRTDKAVEVWYKEPGVASNRVRVNIETSKTEDEKQDTSASSSENSSKDNSKDNSSDDYYPGGNDITYYKITFVTDSKREEKIYKENTLLSTIATPAQPTGKVFLGWYYDKEGTKPVNPSDKLTNNITLYAKFADTLDLVMGGTINYVSVLEQDSDFSIVVISDEIPKSGKDFIFRNITAPDKTPESYDAGNDSLNIETINVEERESGVWVISSANGGFTSGHTYQIELISDDIIFDDSGDAFGNLKEDNDLYDVKEIRFFNFSIEKDGTLNLTLNEEIKYIKAEELNSSDRANLMEYSGLYLTSTDGYGNITYVANSGTGSFVYTGSVEINEGDIVAIYEGTHPKYRNPEKGSDVKTDNDDISYVKITEKEGNIYSYVVAEAEEVIFILDVLPIDIDINDGTTGWSLDGSTVIVDNNSLKNFIRQYEEISLNTDTTVDVGDYLVFYTGDFNSSNSENKAYGRITNIDIIGDSTIISYEWAVESEVLSSMDLYDETELSEEEVKKIINENRDEIQEAIENQIKDSNFFDEAGEYLAQLTLQTDEVKEVFGEDLTLEDCIITYADGTPIGRNDLMLMGNIVDKDKDGNKPKVSVSVSTRLAHFDPKLAGIGVRVEVAVNYNFKIQKKGNNNIMEISLTAFFEQEVTIGFSVSGGAVWKKKWIFPYIADYRVNGNVDLGTYTGIGITATAKLKESKEPWGMPWPNDVRDVEATKKIFVLGKEIEDMMEELETVFPEDEASASGGLAEKYADFMEDANEDWVDLVTADIITINKAADPLHILAFGLDVDFVVSANLNVAMGLTFQYENSKRHTFTLLVLSKQLDSDSIDLATNGFQLNLYVMGHLGLRAGIRAKITAGLISTKIAGIGVQVESGAYARLWGYFYYHIENWKVKGIWQKNNAYSGALLIEIGAYLDVKFIAEALNGKYSYSPTIYAKEWPLWSAGQQENVYDFAYEEDPTFNILNVNTYIIPSVVFDMAWMDLKTGELEDGDELNIKNYDSDKVASNVNEPNEEYFIVELANPNFTYNPHNNKITINNPTGAVTQTCEMKITWKGAPLSKTSEVISRTITLNWSNEANAATIAFDSNGGTAVEMIRLLAGTSLADKMPQAPTRIGYEFGGWYADKDLVNKFIYEFIPAGNTTLYAKWIPKNVNYTVEHYKQNLNGQYDLAERETLSGTVATQTLATAKNYEGFKAKTIKQNTIAADGSTKVAIYYDRISYNLVFNYGYGSVISVTIPYEYEIEQPADPVRKGYVFKGWDTPIPEKMPARDLTTTALWEMGNIKYTVKHIKEALDGKDPQIELTTSYGLIGEETDAQVKPYTGFTAQPFEQKEILEDGSTVVEIYYTRNIHTLTWNFNGGVESASEYTKGDIKYGTLITKPQEPTRVGYTFAGWYKDEALIEKLEDDATMPDNDLTLYAKWVDSTTKYNIWVKGIQITDAIADDVFEDGGSVTYDKETNTLVLNNAQLVYNSNDNKEYMNIQKAIIYSEDNLNIELNGTENVVLNHSYNEYSWNSGIRVFGDLTIKGTGTLLVMGGMGYTSHGISVSGELTIEEATIIAIGQVAEGVSGIYASSRITINGGNVNAIAYIATDGNSRGLESRIITINGGTVVVTANEGSDGSFGMDAYTISISGGNVTASGQTSALHVGTFGEINILNEGNVIMVGDTAPDTAWNGEDNLANYKYFYFSEETSSEEESTDTEDTSSDSEEEMPQENTTEVIDNLENEDAPQDTTGPINPTELGNTGSEGSSEGTDEPKDKDKSNDEDESFDPDESDGLGNIDVDGQ